MNERSTPVSLKNLAGELVGREIKRHNVKMAKSLLFGLSTLTCAGLLAAMNDSSGPIYQIMLNNLDKFQALHSIIPAIPAVEQLPGLLKNLLWFMALNNIGDALSTYIGGCRIGKLKKKLYAAIADEEK